MKRIFAVAALFTGSPSFAQSDTSILNTIVVTANKYPSKTSRTGKVITVITRQDLEKAGGRDLAQLLTEQGGVYINGANSNTGKDKSVYLRGARVEHTLITVDGIPVYDASGIGANFDLRQLSIDQVERVEILKGSQGTLYGSDAIAGVINIITRKGGTKPFGGSATVNYGTYNTLRTSLGLNGKAGKLDYSAGYTYLNTDGVSEAAKPVGSTADFDKDGFSQNAAQLTVGIAATNHIRLQPFLRYSKNRGDLDGGGFTDVKNYTYTGKNLQTGIRNEIGLGKGQLNLIYQYTGTDRSYEQPGMASAYKAAEHYGEAYAVLPVANSTFTGGLDYRAANTDQVSGSSFIPNLGKDSVHHRQIGIYAAANAALHSFNLEAGGRVNFHSEYGSHAAFNLNPSYLINGQWKVFANLSSGYKTPSLYQLFSNYGNRELKPESALNAEGGVQYFTRNEKGTVRANYFYRHINDVINFGFNPATQGYSYLNDDEQTDKGFEVEGRWKGSEKLEVKALYTYVTGKLITTTTAGKDTTYFNLFRRPKSQFTASIGSRPVAPLYLNLSATVIGKALDVTFPPPQYNQVEVTLDNYVLLNFYAEYGLLKGRLKLFADLRNLTDARYTEILGYSTQGLTINGGLRVQW